MKKLLLETGIQEDTNCPYCGYDEAVEDYESRAEYQPANFKFAGGYYYGKSCPMCGWSEYNDYSPTDEEEDEDKGECPLDPYLEYEPNDENIAVSKRIQKLTDKAPDEVNNVLVNTIFDLFEPQKHDFEDFKCLVFNYIFTK